MSKITDAFAHGKAFIPFFTCGDPNLETTYEAIKLAVDNGADLVELGIPFSDPTAEGPVIQEANLRALKQGVTTDLVFSLVERLRTEAKITVPFVFMTYANVVFSYGTERFMQRCEEVGVNGIILPDVPYEEKGEFEPICLKHNVELLSMIAPTSEQRIAKIASEARGFIYVVSSLGVTGTRTKITTDLPSIIKVIRQYSKQPCAIGFGISTPEQAHDMAAISDGAIVGSAIIKLLARYGAEDGPQQVATYVRSMKDAIRDL